MAVLPSRMIRLELRFAGSGMLQKRWKIAVAITVKRIRHQTPISACQSRRTSAQPANCSAIPIQNAAAGNGVPNAAMRSMWSLIRAFVRLQIPVARKQSTMSSLPAVSVHERSPYMNLFSYNFRRHRAYCDAGRVPIPDRIRHATRNDPRHQDQLSRTEQVHLSADDRAPRLA